MDPRQSALPLQLHGNSFAVSSGRVPEVIAGCDGGGQDAELNQQNMTSSARVTSRLGPGEQFQSPLEPPVHCHAKGKLDIESRSCSLLTICRSGVTFPWMNSRTTDSDQSGNSAFIYYQVTLTLWLRLQKIVEWWGESMTTTHNDSVPHSHTHVWLSSNNFTCHMTHCMPMTVNCFILHNSIHTSFVQWVPFIILNIPKYIFSLLLGQTSVWMSCSSVKQMSVSGSCLFFHSCRQSRSQWSSILFWMKVS